VNLPTGIVPLDERVSGLRSGGLYLLTGAADTAKLAFILQFVAEGLRRGERVAILAAATPASVIEQAEYFGFDLATHWHDGSCILLGFKGDYPRRVVHTPDPNEAFAELEGLVSPPVDRIGVDPGSFLWSTRAGTTMAQGFQDWVAGSGATVVASVATGLDDRPDPATEWVMQRASGVFHFTRLTSGLHELTVGRMSPPVETAGPISLELTSGSGLGEPTGSIDRRRSDRGTSGGDRLYLVELGGRAPADLAGWLSRNRDTVRLTDGMSLIQKLPSTPAGTVCVYVDREHTDEAVELIRALRPLTPAAVLLLSDHELRSGDQAAALDAGADDVLSGGIDFRELDARIRRARESSRRQDPAPAAEAGPVPIDGLLDEADFRQMLDDRLDSREEELFSLLRFDLPQVRDMGEALLSSVRSDSGDVVGPLAGGYGVLLQDARAQQAESFLRRVQTELRRRGHDVTLEAEILSNPEQREHIRALVGT
jgi:hypothetical protein